MKRIRAALAAGILVVFAAGAVVAQDGYSIRAGDTLRIEVLQDPGLNRTVLVSPDGRVTFPLAGGLPAAGRTLEEVQADLAERLAPNFAAPPNVFVALESLAQPRAATGDKAVATIDVFVVGEAEGPGKLEVKPGTTVLQAFALMGGFTPFAATKRIQLRRDGKTYGLNYDAIERGSSASGTTVLRDGDVILVPQRRLFE